MLLYSVDGFLLQLFRVDQLGRFFFNQQLHRVFDFQLTRFLLLAAEVLEHGLQLAGHLFHARRGHDFNAHRRRSEIDFNLFIVKLAFTQFLAERLARSRGFLRLFSLAPVVFRRWDQHVKHALFRQLFRAVTVLIDGLHANHFDRRIGQIADDRVYFFTNIAHFGEFGRFNFNKRRVGQFRQTTGNLGFTDAGWADHQNVFRRDFMTQLFVKLHTAPAVTQGNSNRTLGGVLADNVFVQFADNFAWGHFRHGRSLRFRR